jgi:hypothetical protein
LREIVGKKKKKKRKKVYKKESKEFRVKEKGEERGKIPRIKRNRNNQELGLLSGE